jgi:hypothetical protein
MEVVMRSLVTVTVALALVAALSLSVCAEESEGVTKDDIPAVVLKAFQKANPDIRVEGYDMEELDGKVVYEIETRKGDADRDFVYLEDGTLLQVEEEMAVESLPRVVADAVMKAHPKGEIDEAEKITRGATVEYAVVVEVNDDEFDLLVSSDGKVLSSVKAGEDEAEADDADEGDEEEEDD